MGYENKKKNETQKRLKIDPTAKIDSQASILILIYNSSPLSSAHQRPERNCPKRQIFWTSRKHLLVSITKLFLKIPYSLLTLFRALSHGFSKPPLTPKTSFRKPPMTCTFAEYLFAGCVSHSFAYVAYFVFLRDAWIPTQGREMPEQAGIILKSLVVRCFSLCILFLVLN